MSNWLSPEGIIDKKKTFFYPNTMHFYKQPPHIVKGEMQYLYDHNGKRYTDFFAGVTVLNCGHSNPEIIEAIELQLENLQHTSIIYLTQPMVELAEKLATKLPGDIQTTFFCNSGTEANEGALLLARMHTGKKGFVALEGGLHGRSHLTMSVTGIPMWRIDPFLEEDVYFAPCYATSGEDTESASQKTIDAIEAILKVHGHEIAAFIVEPMQGNGGMMVPSDDFFKKLKPILEKHEVLLIADEVQTGFARTGKYFAMAHFDVVPDIITYAKALGNGVPIGAFSARPHVAASFNKPSASTLGGNPVSSTAGIAVLDYIDRHDLVSQAEVLGAILKAELIKLSEQFDCFKEVRGLGLMLGVEVAGERSPEIVDYILEEMKNRGFIIGKNGMNRNVLAFQPPLVITKADIHAMINELIVVLESLPIM